LPNIHQYQDYLSASADVEPGEERLLSANFIYVILANFFYALGVQAMNATLPVYILNIGGTQAQAGLIGGLTSITALLFRPLVGWLTDVWRRRPIALTGVSFYGLSSVIYALSSSIGFLAFGRVVQGLGISCYSTASTSYVADIVPTGNPHELRLAHETKNMVLSAEMRLRSALFRTESRGNHFREDYPRRDDPNWLAWTKIRAEHGKMMLIKVPVPKEWWPDLSTPYEQRYPFRFPGE